MVLETGVMNVAHPTSEDESNDQFVVNEEENVKINGDDQVVLDTGVMHVVAHHTDEDEFRDSWGRSR